MIPVFQWMAWGNIFKYAGEILVANEFHDLKLTCGKNGKQISVFLWHTTRKNSGYRCTSRYLCILTNQLKLNIFHGILQSCKSERTTNLLTRP